MPKVNDIKSYWREKAAAAGLSDDELKQAQALIDNEKFAKTFGESFKPLPDYSHDLDDVRNKTRAQVQAEMKDWSEKELAKYNQNYQQRLAVEERIRQYEAMYGPMDGTQTQAPGTTQTPPNAKYMTQEEVDRYISEQLAKRDEAYLSFRDADFDHMRRFNKPLDRKAFEEAWKEHRTKGEWNTDLYSAYEKFIAPEIEKSREAEIEKRIQAAREEGIRDGYSRRSLPADTAAKQFSPLFDRKEDVGKMSDQQQERHSHEAFMTGLREGK